MIRFLAAAAVTLFAVASASAASPAYYVATPLAAPVWSDLVTRHTDWRLDGASYVADRAAEKPEVLCHMVAQRAGGLSAFSAGGRAFDADALATCNGKPRQAATAIATQ